MRKIAIYLLLCAGCFGEQNTQDDHWKSLRFLIGSWDAKTSGGAQSSGWYAFAPDLKNHVLVRRSSADDCKAGSESICEHSDVLYIYSEVPGKLHAIYFDSEGHVIHYKVTSPTPASAVFFSDDSIPGPQYRLSYELAAGMMRGKFQLKIPGQADFKSYLEWSGARR